MEKITLTIDENGYSKVAVDGIKGRSCVDATRFLEDGFGGHAGARKKTGEYYEQERKQHQTRSN